MAAPTSGSVSPASRTITARARMPQVSRRDSISPRWNPETFTTLTRNTSFRPIWIIIVNATHATARHRKIMPRRLTRSESPTLTGSVDTSIDTAGTLQKITPPHERGRGVNIPLAPAEIKENRRARGEGRNGSSKSEGRKAKQHLRDANSFVVAVTLYRSLPTLHFCH